ncbi:ribonuclease T2 family protein [Massilia sp. DWR3-1-1]|uniref:ribonuclease T2 family protein n=1 Tax=Massilia sp. DWR3-1-1 TaxID=2804559 RepID=UPI003CF02EE1
MTRWTSNKTALAALLLALTCAGAQAGGPRHQRSEGEPGRFDYYAVALSWSPAFCATHDDPNQCAPGRQAGFVLHGLWPQYQRGYPQSCSTEPLSSADRARYAPLYPSPKLIGHEWQKHGTCSGLAPAAYFALSARLRQQLRIPAPFEKPAQPLRTTYADFVGAFRAANPRLPEHAVLPFCGAGGRFLNEIHACYDKGGASMACGEAEIRRSRNTCRQDSFLLQSGR